MTKKLHEFAMPPPPPKADNAGIVIEIYRTVRDADFTTDWTMEQTKKQLKGPSGPPFSPNPFPRMALDDQSTQDYIRLRAYEIYVQARRGPRLS